MMLALRTQPASDARWPVDHIAHRTIKARLVTRYPHAGIVIGGKLYHATARDGLHVADYTPARWVLIDLGTARDADALHLFAEHDGAGYDWLSLLAFVGLRARDSHRYYCYEWCWHCMTGQHPTRRITPEDLLMQALAMGGRLVWPEGEGAAHA